MNDEMAAHAVDLAGALHRELTEAGLPMAVHIDPTQKSGLHVNVINKRVAVCWWSEGGEIVKPGPEVQAQVLAVMERFGHVTESLNSLTLIASTYKES